MMFLFQGQMIFGQSQSSASTFATITYPVGMVEAEQVSIAEQSERLTTVFVEANKASQAEVLNFIPGPNTTFVKQITAFLVLGNASVFDVTIMEQPIIKIQKSKAPIKICCFTLKPLKTMGSSSFNINATINADQIKAPGVNTINYGPEVIINFN